jgi:FAD/FMN-containing dehydrogenase
VESAWIVAEHRRTRGLAETLEAFAGDDRHRYSVAWVDTLAAGDAAGRGVLMEGDHAPPDALPRSVRDPLALPRRAARRLPFDLPGGALNRLTVGAFNTVYHGVQRPGRRVVDLESYFYPLDSLLEWNRLYGRRGFAQLQVVVPAESAAEGLGAVLRRLREAGLSSFLAVLKRFGEAGPGLLSFPRPGYTLALDLPFRDALPAALAEVHRVVLDHGGRVYLAKDSALDRAGFERMYPEADRFRAVRRRVDPGGRLSSSLARRVGLAEER